ncbi:hypothetical protein LDL36_20265 [Komagataeibacter sp. FNDCR1]|nr:hypothetical protein [Komagataeibacter sp. FNDCR1]
MLPASLSETQVASVARAMMPAQEQDWSETDLKGFMRLARKAAEAVIGLGSPILPSPNVETVCREHITGTDEIRPGVSALVFRQGAELVRREAMDAQVAHKDDQITCLTQECYVLKEEIARLQKLALPAEMSPDIAAALGIICFQAAPFAAAFRSAGENIPSKAEAEQAFVIFRILRGVLAGGNFDQAWDALLEDAVAAQEQAKKDRLDGGMS